MWWVMDREWIRSPIFVVISIGVGSGPESDLLLYRPRTPKTRFRLILNLLERRSLLVSIGHHLSCQLVQRILLLSLDLGRIDVDLLSHRVIALCGAFRGLWFFGFVEEAIEDDVIVVLRDEAWEVVVFFQETYEFLGRAVIGQPFWGFCLTPQELLKHLLNNPTFTLPIPVLWHDSCT